MKRRIFKPEHKMFRKSFRGYLKDKIIPQYDDWEKAGITPREVWLEAGKNGWLCPTAEERYGGPGGDFLYSLIITEEIYYHALNGLFWWVHSDIFLPYIEKYADEALKQKWIPKCISGETILALAMTEPEVGKGQYGFPADTFGYPFLFECFTGILFNIWEKNITVDPPEKTIQGMIINFFGDDK